MIILFWLVAVVMIAVALAALLPPLLGRGRHPGAVRDQLNVTIFNERIADLDAELRSGQLSQAEHEEAKRELQRELLADVAAGSPGAEAPRPVRSPWAAALVGVAVPILAVGLYLKLGDSRVLTGQGATGSQAQAGKGMPSVEQMVASLAQRMQTNPDDAQGWVMLGRSYMVMNRYADARDAYEKAYKLVGDQPEIMADLAEAVAMANNGQLGGRPAELVDKVLAGDPDNAKALWLGGMAAFQAGDFKQAVERWNRLAPKIPAQSEDGRLIEKYLGQARSHLSKEQLAEVEPKGPPPQVATTGGLKVEVSFAPALAGRVAPTDTVFVFARAVDGPKMPLAVMRSPARDLPSVVELDDSMAMAPAFKLSSFPQVVVGARISKSGTVTPGPGDLEGFSAPVAPGSEQPVQVVVNQVVGQAQEPAGASPPPSAEPPQEQTPPAAAAPEATGQSSPPATESSLSASSGAGQVTVHVSLDSSVANRAKPGETVFIFARAPQGPRMPLAIVRKQVSDLPADVTLDDSMAMAPAFRVPMFPQVAVAARVSQTGNAIPSPGDLQGQVTDVKVGGPPVDLTIDHVVP
jgi:cytochrome c-type biogenesis protein CcmH